jgi:hypothetical protein
MPRNRSTAAATTMIRAPPTTPKKTRNGSPDCTRYPNSVGEPAATAVPREKNRAMASPRISAGKISLTVKYPALATAEAKKKPKVLLIARSTRPRTRAGTSSSMAELIAEYSPPMASPVRKRNSAKLHSPQEKAVRIAPAM